jgi:nucleoside 2-deoxyribosyltransferase
VKIYVASPLGFSEAGRAFHDDVLVPPLRGLGHEVLDPWRLTDTTKIEAVAAMRYGAEKRDTWRRLNAEIGRDNMEVIDRADAVLAVLDGVDVDSGTAAEIGYAFARGKPILGYRGDFRFAGDNEGGLVNLQVEFFIRESGGDIVTRIADIPEALTRIADIATKNADRPQS